MPSTNEVRRTNSQILGRMRRVRSRLVGRTGPAVVAAAVAVLSAFAVAERVAARDAYLRIEHALPTYAGTPDGFFFAAGAALVLVAALGAAFRAGVVPTTLLAAGPVFGWAVTHRTAPITPQYAVTFPFEMAVLYGGVFGLLGYVVGVAARRAARRLRGSVVAR